MRTERLFDKLTLFNHLINQINTNELPPKVRSR
ncbi:unnamed protein product [Schistosoma curassoni]|uniref:Transcriptional regulator n=1 Tax=Schistosoma curassoni TaxID=6186 RepID=A0A183JVE1_9TREM|nr:unnamed protein product [Schistosoma curassoni]